MVSNAIDDLPDPLGPVKTTIFPRGRLTLTFFRLCCRAPTTTSLSTVDDSVSTERCGTWTHGSPDRVSADRAREVPPQIVDPPDADAEAQEPIGDVGGGAGLGRHRRVGRGCRVYEQASY